MALVDIQVPDIGDFDEVGVIELLVKPGDTVKVEQSLITVESDKASMEIPSSHAGTVKEVKVALGDKIKQGSVIVVLEAADGAAPKSEEKSGPAQAGPASGAANSEAPAPAPTAAPAAPSAPAAPAVPLEVRVPDIGDFKDVAVIELLVKVGDTVKVEQSLFTVESDKASMEIPSPAAGVVKELKVKIGDTLNIGDLVAILEGTPPAPSSAPIPPGTPTLDMPAAQSEPDTPTPRHLPVEEAKPLDDGASRRAAGSAPAAAAPAPAAVAAAPAPAAPPHAPGAVPAGLPHASPSVRKFARELGVPLDEVKGTGLKGRITQDDVAAFTKQVMAGSTQTKAQLSSSAAKAPAGGGSATVGGSDRGPGRGARRVQPGDAGSAGRDRAAGRRGRPAGVLGAAGVVAGRPG